MTIPNFKYTPPLVGAALQLALQLKNLESNKRRGYTAVYEFKYFHSNSDIILHFSNY